METKEKLKSLAEEAAILIKEFDEVDILSEDLFNEVNVKENGVAISVDDVFEGKAEYPLTKISSVFDMCMRGWGPEPAGFYDALEEAKYELKDSITKCSKEEFKKYAGDLAYAEYRCEAIYERLKEIEEEAERMEA
ncbi:MAG: hypothetical protein MR639_13150 [Clostridium sp.]|uniref:hypothetical protein n=1 Tax=Clostridium sp. TaxID=1506 RepID=UPI002A876DD9|nr:hypothetical protein [Clostridium sp.]MDY5096972.1 hypothetical protein [Clostridium sp.]